MEMIRVEIKKMAAPTKERIANVSNKIYTFHGKLRGKLTLLMSIRIV